MMAIVEIVMAVIDFRTNEENDSTKRKGSKIVEEDPATRRVSRPLPFPESNN